MQRISLRIIRSKTTPALVFPTMARVTNNATGALSCRLSAITLAEEELAAVKVDAHIEVTTQFKLLVAALETADEVEGNNENRRRRELEYATAGWARTIRARSEQAIKRLRASRATALRDAAERCDAALTDASEAELDVALTDRDVALQEAAASFDAQIRQAAAQAVRKLLDQRDRELTEIRARHESERLAASLELNGARVALEDLHLVEQHLLGIIDQNSADSADGESSTGADGETTAP